MFSVYWTHASMCVCVYRVCVCVWVHVCVILIGQMCALTTEKQPQQRDDLVVSACPGGETQLSSVKLKLKPFFRFVKNDIDFTVYSHTNHTRTHTHTVTNMCVYVEKLVGLNCLRSGDKCVALPRLSFSASPSSCFPPFRLVTRFHLAHTHPPRLEWFIGKVCLGKLHSVSPLAPKCSSMSHCISDFPIVPLMTY